MTIKISDWMLEQYLLNELPANRMREIREQLQTDMDLQTRLAKLEQSNTDILKAYPAKTLANKIRMRQAAAAKPGRTAPIPRHWPWRTLSLAAAAAVVFLVLPLAQQWLSPAGNSTRLKGSSHRLYYHKANPLLELLRTGAQNDTRLKGGNSSLYIYRKAYHQVELLYNGTPAKQGDLLQILYWTQKDPYGVILSLDGAGKVTLHYPATVQATTKLSLNEKTPLPSAYELDNAPRFERFFFITSQSEINTGLILEAARRLAKTIGPAQTQLLALDKSLHQLSILLKKED